MKINSLSRYVVAALSCALMVAFASTALAQYYVAGDFNGWTPGDAGYAMTQDTNPVEYSLTINASSPGITGFTPGSYHYMKVETNSWSSSWPSSDNLYILADSTGSATINFWPGATTDGWLPTANRVGYADPDNDPGWGVVGSFNGWNVTNSVPLLPIGNGVYSNTIIVPTAGSFTYKFTSPLGTYNDINFGSPDFGNGNNNASGITTTSNQAVPVVLDLPDGRYYAVAPALPPTNYITFELDMSEQVAFGNFTNTDENTNDPNFGLPVNSVAIAGLNGDWGTDMQLTNYTTLYPNDNNPGLKTNLYIGTYTLQGYLPQTFDWKFRVNNLDGGYELPVSTSGGNRVTTITNQYETVGPISYDDEGLGDLVVSNTTVTWTLYMTNGTPTTFTNSSGGPYYFTKGTDTIYVNGPWANWDWGNPISPMPADQQMNEVGTSDYYTNSWLFPRGSSIYVTYKYSVDSVDDENGTGTNHIREIRNYGPAYSFPQDVWSLTVLYPGSGDPYPLDGLSPTNIVEPDFGHLTIGAPSGGKFPITWLGRPAVMLQNSSSLTGTWNSISATDGTESTNWPNAGGTQYFRLIEQ
jgi:hypothetical protein